MKQSKTEKTRAHIIAKTAGIFNKKGYAGTSIADITKATKLTSGSIYGNFANKEEVAVAALDYNIGRFRDFLQRGVSRGDTTKERLFAYINVFRSSSNFNFSGGGCPMQNALIDADDTMEPLRRRAADGILQWKKDIATVIEAGKAEGVFKPDTDSDKIALHIIALCEFAFLMHSAGQRPEQLDGILDMASDVAKSIII